MDKGLYSFDTENKDLLLSVLSKDEDSYHKLMMLFFNRAVPEIKRFYKLNYFDIDDIKQNTLIKIWNNLNLFDNKLSFYNWAYSILKNEALSFVKKKSQIAKIEILDSDITVNCNYEKFSLGENIDLKLEETAEMILSKKEELIKKQQFVKNILNSLSPKHNQILNLIFIDNKSYKEISKQLNIPIGTVMSRLSYAKQEARKLAWEEINAL